MTAPFEAPRLKIGRAVRHLQELRDEVSAYFAEKPCAVVVAPFFDMDPSHFHAWIARIRRPVPAQFSAIIGDVVHNLRTALDLLACDLVRVSGKSAKAVYFPFCATAAELPQAIRNRNLHHAGHDVVKAVMSLKPYAVGNPALRAIHDMDIADKHQALVPVIGAITIPGRPLHADGLSFQMPSWSSAITHDGQMIIGLPAVKNLPLGTELPASFYLVIGIKGPLGGSEVLAFLHQLTKVAIGVVETLAALRPGATFPETTATPAKG